MKTDRHYALYAYHRRCDNRAANDWIDTLHQECLSKETDMASDGGCSPGAVIAFMVFFGFVASIIGGENFHWIAIVAVIFCVFWMMSRGMGP